MQITKCWSSKSVPNTHISPQYNTVPWFSQVPTAITLWCQFSTIYTENQNPESPNKKSLNKGSICLVHSTLHQHQPARFASLRKSEPAGAGKLMLQTYYLLTFSCWFTTTMNRLIACSVAKEVLDQAFQQTAISPHSPAVVFVTKMNYYIINGII